MADEAGAGLAAADGVGDRARPARTLTCPVCRTAVYLVIVTSATHSAVYRCTCCRDLWEEEECIG